MAKNASLRKAGGAKNDEFYTQLSDIENEMCHYTDYFIGKTILCNCDDPYESNFFYYFATRFNDLKLKKLICTSYDNSPIAYTQMSFLDKGITVPNKNRKAYKIEICEVGDYNGDGVTDVRDIDYLLKNKENTFSVLDGNGDFRSDECIELLKQADIVITNPPFSLFREYVAQLIKHEKKFIIIGNQNALTYKEIFPLLMQNRMWLGVSIHSGDREFQVPYSYPLNATNCRIDKNGKKFIRVKGIRWYTNLDYPQRHEDLQLYKKYTPEEYPKYDNYDAINVNKTAEIPYDYDGYMGVPITFMDKYNPEQFEIIDGIGRYSILHNEETKKAGKYLSMIDSKAIYFRYIIKNKKVEGVHNEN